MNPVVTAQATTAAVSLSEAKEHFKQYSDHEDDLIERNIDAATIYIESDIKRSILSRTFRLDMDCFSRMVKLPYPPIASIVDVTYFDPDGDSQTVDSANYRLIGSGDQVEFDCSFNFPSVYSRLDAVSIQYVAGYETTDLIPSNLKAAIQLVALDMYENRGSQVLGLNVNTNKTLDRLLQFDREYSLK